MMAVAIDQAREAKIAISCCIVDAGGHVVVLERMDGGRFHTLHSCTTKAVCAASNKRATTAKGAVGQDLDVTHALGLALAAGPERWTAMEGGVPILANGECIGGVGVSGGDWETDLRSRRPRSSRSARAGSESCDGDTSVPAPHGVTRSEASPSRTIGSTLGPPLDPARRAQNARSSR